MRAQHSAHICTIKLIVDILNERMFVNFVWNCATESHDGKHEAVRLNLQQQVVYRHVNHTISQQERFV